MKSLPPPLFSATVAVQTCAAGITIAERAQALLDALPVIQASETEYMELGRVGQLFMVAGSTAVTTAVDSDLMSIIYKSHFVRTGSPSRTLYEQIRMAPKHGICPLCCQRVVGTVDHYLPQSIHPKLNLTPINLIPACSDCNKKKLASVASNAESQTLHPYFDDLGNDRWLVVDVQETVPPAIAFSIRPPIAWSQVLAARVIHHFHLMGIGDLYIAQAASEMSDISYSLKEVGEASGTAGIHAHLDGQYRSRRARDPNSWKTALYEGLRDSQWFCNEGYKLIRPE